MTRNRGRLGLRRAHRWLGIALLAPLLLLVVTGILLNHTEGLGLDQRHAGSVWLVGAYGIRPEPPETGFPVGDAWVSHARGTVFLGARPLGEAEGPLVGAARVGGVLAVATPQAIHLYTEGGRPIDTLELPGSVPPATRFALVDGRPTLAGPAGAYSLNAEMTGWVSDASRSGSPVEPRPLPSPVRAEIASRLAATTLSWERVLLDLHSGRLFGRLGPWLMDLAALAVAILATTGCVMWLRVTRARRHRRRRR